MGHDERDSSVGGFGCGANPGTRAQVKVGDAVVVGPATRKKAVRFAVGEWLHSFDKVKLIVKKLLKRLLKRQNFNN